MKINATENTQPLNNDKNVKKDKASLILLIIGIVLFVITLVLTILFGIMSIEFFLSSGGEQIGTALGYAIYLAYFGLPAMITGVIASILNIISVALSKKRRGIKITFMILSIVVTIMTFSFYSISLIK